MDKRHDLWSRLHDLLALSMQLWGVENAVVSAPLDGVIEISAGRGQVIRITENDLPIREFARWSVCLVGSRPKFANSVLGILSTTRELLGADASPGLPLRLGVMGVGQ